MSRFEAHGPNHSLAYGVDHMPLIGTFLQVWDNTKYDMPDGDNIKEDHNRVSPEAIIAMAKAYDIPLDFETVYANLEATPNLETLKRLGILS